MIEAQAWNTKLERLEHPQKLKIRKFVEHGCILRVDKDTYSCLPLLGYNSTTYTMRRTQDGSWRCNCQGFHAAEKRHGQGDCSHLQALYICMAKDDNDGMGTLF
jgi:hypothetical protein